VSVLCNKSAVKIDVFRCFHWRAVCFVICGSRKHRGNRLQYTIEARALTSEYTHRPAFDVESRRTFVEAEDSQEAITRFVRLSDAELVSCTHPGRGRESIATMKKEDAVFLVRVYTD
jgi:hypothetical protein